MQAPQNPNHPQNPVPPPIPEMVGATNAAFFLGSQLTEVTLAIHAATGPAQSAAELLPRGVSLNVENVTCDLPAPNYAVYLNVPPGDVPEHHPELLAGSLGMFGLIEASRRGDKHGASGLNFKMNVTGLYHRLALMKDWDRKNLRIYFVPGDWDAPIPKVRVGRVALYFA